MSDARKDLPADSSVNWGQRVNETLRSYLGLQGDGLDRGVTLRDLITSGIVGLQIPGSKPGTATTPLVTGPAISAAAAYVIDLTPPPTPTGLIVTAGINALYIECDDELYTQGHGHAETIVYGAKWTTGALPTFSSAVEITRFKGKVFAYATEPNTEWHIWINWRSVDGVNSALPAGGANGVMAKTGQDVRKLLEAITAGANDPAQALTQTAIRADQFYVADPASSYLQPIFSVVTVSFTQGGVVVPVGVYFKDGYIQNGTITNLKVANAAIDDAKIANLSASKITTGSIAVGQYAQSTGFISGSSGWKIEGNGAAEFAAVTVRGTVYASAGQIGGSDIGATFVKSSNYNFGTLGWYLDNTNGRIFANGGINGGDFAGTYTWPSTTTGKGFHLSKDGLLMGNATSVPPKYVQIDSDGTFFSPYLVMNGGGATFSGALSAASGSFAGVLTAAAINAVDTINIAGAAVTIPLCVVGSYSPRITPSLLATDVVYTATRHFNATADLFVSVTVQANTEPSYGSCNCRVRCRLVSTAGYNGVIFDSWASIPTGWTTTFTFCGPATIPYAGDWAVTCDIDNNFTSSSWVCNSLAIVAIGAKR